MRKFIFVAGLPGSGKTTFSRRLAEVSGAYYVDVDKHKKMRVDKNKVTKEVDPPEIRVLYCRDALKEALCLLDKEVTTAVMDEVYPYRCVRSDIEEACNLWEVDVVWVEIRTHPDTAKKRLLSKREGHILSPEDAVDILRKCRTVFEAFPRGCSNHIVVNNEDGDDIDELVAGVLSRI